MVFLVGVEVAPESRLDGTGAPEHVAEGVVAAAAPAAGSAGTANRGHAAGTGGDGGLDLAVGGS